MTIRKQLILIVSGMIFLAVLIYSLVSTVFINNEFSGYVESEYTDTVERLKAQAAAILTAEQTDEAQAEQTLSVYLSGLIEQISVLDASGQAVATAQETGGMMHGGMMRRQTAGTDYFTISQNGQEIGTMVITRTSAVQDSETVLVFKRTVILSAVISGLIAFAVSILLIVFTSTRMTKDLRQTAAYAGNADSEATLPVASSKVVEVRAIQQSLANLSAKLRLQKRARQEKIDQLSHEVRTPLSILKTNCEAVKDGIVEMDPGRLESCIVEIDHLSSILSTITDVIEYGGGEISAHTEQFDLCEAIRRIAKGFRLQYENKGLALLLEGERRLPVNTDKSLLTQAVYNLISNAYKYTPQGGNVRVAVAAQGDVAVISVCDSGPGVLEQDRGRIFDAYQRGSVPQNAPGEGLGLFIARRNVEAVGGSIRVQNQPQGGACFTLEIPMG